MPLVCTLLNIVIATIWNCSDSKSQSAQPNRNQIASGSVSNCIWNHSWNHSDENRCNCISQMSWIWNRQWFAASNQRAPNPPEFTQPRLSRVKRRSSLGGGNKFGCVCSYMAGRYPCIRPNRNKHTQICNPRPGATAVWPYSNGAV